MRCTRDELRLSFIATATNDVSTVSTTNIGGGFIATTIITTSAGNRFCASKYILAWKMFDFDAIKIVEYLISISCPSYCGFLCKSLRIDQFRHVCKRSHRFQ